MLKVFRKGDNIKSTYFELMKFIHELSTKVWKYSKYKAFESEITGSSPVIRIQLKPLETA